MADLLLLVLAGHCRRQVGCLQASCCVAEEGIGQPFLTARWCGRPQLKPAEWRYQQYRRKLGHKQLSKLQTACTLHAHNGLRYHRAVQHATTLKGYRMQTSANTCHPEGAAYVLPTLQGPVQQAQATAHLAGSMAGKKVSHSRSAWIWVK